MSLKDLIFQKGGIGTSMSRQETIERLNPIIERHMALNHYYNDAIARSGEPEVAARLEALQKTARADVGKLMETVFSAGGVAYNGVEMEPSTFRLADGGDDLLFDLFDREQEFRDDLTDELKQLHQIRSQAIINMVYTNSQNRLNFLKDITKRRRRSHPADL